MALESFIQYYSKQYDAFTVGAEHEFGRHPSEVLDPHGRLKEPFATDIATAPARPESIERFRNGYELQIRGKCLFALLIRLLSHSSRAAKHSYKSLCETGVKITNPTSLERIVQECRVKLAA